MSGIFIILFIIGFILVLFVRGSRGSLQMVLIYCLAAHILFVCLVCYISIVTYYDDPTDYEQRGTETKQEIEQWEMEYEQRIIEHRRMWTEKRRKLEKLLGLEVKTI